MAVQFLTSAQVTSLLELYVAYFNRAPEASGLSYWSNYYITQLNAGKTDAQVTSDIANQFYEAGVVFSATSGYSASMTAEEFITKAYANVLSRSSVDAEGMAYWKAKLEAGTLSKGDFIKQLVADAKTYIAANPTDAVSVAVNNSLNARLEVAQEFSKTSISGSLTGDAAVTAGIAALSGVTDSASADAKITSLQDAAVAAAGQNFTLTIGVDSGAAFTGGSGNDTFTAAYDAANGAHTLTGLDAINGGLGNDTLNVTDSDGGNIDVSLPASVTGIETVNILTVNTLSGNAADISDWTDVTAANFTVKNAVVQTLTVADTTALSATNTLGGLTVHGGSSQNVTVKGGALTADEAVGAVTVTSTSTAGNNITVDNGTSVAITATGVTTGAVAVGAGGAPSGAVTVTSTGDYTAGTDVTLGAIGVTGGSTVTVTQSAGLTAAEITAAETNTDNFTVTQSAVTVTGGSATTAVTVTQQAAQAEVDNTTTTTEGVIGIVNGTVTIADKNAASATAANTIATVSLTNFGAATIDSAALATVNLAGTGTSLAITQGALTTPTTTSQTLNLTDLTLTGNLTLDNDITTANIAVSGDVDLQGTQAIAGATTLNISGAGDFTSAGETLTALTTLNITNTGSTTLATALGTGVTVTAGDGDDSIIVGATTKTITMGAGDDTVQVNASAITGSINAGTGDADVLSMSAANAITASASETFEGKISGFERVSLGAVAATGEVKLNNLDDINYVTVAGVDNGQTLTLSGAVANTTVNLNNGTTGTGAVTVTYADATGSADVLNVGISNTTAKTVVTLTAASIETINFATDESDTASGIAHAVTTLTATSAKTVNVAGDAGLNLGTFSATTVTNFNASGVTKGAVTWTTGALAGAATISGGAGNDSLNAALATKAVTLSGNGGNDTLVGGLLADTIDGGAGNDWLFGRQGADSLTGGSGQDIFAVAAAAHSNGVNSDTIVDFVVGTDKIGVEIELAGGGGNEVITYIGEASSYGTVLTSFTGTVNEAVLDTSTKTVYIDVDGDAALTASDISINVNVSDLSQSDFATLGTTGADTFAMSAGVDTIYGLGGGDAYALTAANTASLASVSTSGKSISTVGMDVIAQAIATDTIDFTGAVQTVADYDTLTVAAAGANISKTVVAKAVNEFSGLYDYATNTFTSTTDAAGDTASTTDVAALLYLFASTDAATTANQGIVMIGVDSQAGNLANGILTIA